MSRCGSARYIIEQMSCSRRHVEHSVKMDFIVVELWGMGLTIYMSGG